MPFITNWGQYPKVEAQLWEPRGEPEIKEIILSNSGPLIARGNGKSYGDASLGERIVSLLGMNKILNIDIENQYVECESGVLLSEILKLVVPKGLFLPVTPGTKFITVGGAIAADVHGKNHHKEGCFSEHLLYFDLMLQDGSVRRCSQRENAELFWRTCGGMGLSGIILRAAFRLKKIETAYIAQKSIKAGNLDEIDALFDEHQNATYSVAWIDCLQKKSLGRSVLMLGEHVPLSDFHQGKESLALGGQSALTVPTYFPSFLLNRFNIKAFNFLFYHKQFSKTKESQVHYEPFFYPLDKLNHWNRLYGKNGFTQYQFVLPKARGKEGLELILKKIADSGEGAFLAVLKVFGEANPHSTMGFPMKGYTLALDFKVNDRVFRLLNELDEIVLAYGGRLYLAKDARVAGGVFRKMHPGFEPKLEGFRSLQAGRIFG